VAEVRVLDKGTGYVLQLGASVTIDPPLLCGGEASGVAAKVSPLLSPTIPSSSPAAAAASSSSSNSPMMYYSSLTAQLQQLLPPNTVLVFDAKAGRYRVLDEKLNLMPLPSTMMMDPLFGSIGRSPLAKER
jgi:TPP-dependent 2-oxoacid decarboxylase